MSVWRKRHYHPAFSDHLFSHMPPWELVPLLPGVPTQLSVFCPSKVTPPIEIGRGVCQSDIFCFNGIVMGSGISSFSANFIIISEYADRAFAKSCWLTASFRIFCISRGQNTYQDGTNRNHNHQFYQCKTFQIFRIWGDTPRSLSADKPIPPMNPQGVLLVQYRRNYWFSIPVQQWSHSACISWCMKCHGLSLNIYRMLFSEVFSVPQKYTWTDNHSYFSLWQKMVRNTETNIISLTQEFNLQKNILTFSE